MVGTDKDSFSVIILGVYPSMNVEPYVNAYKGMFKIY